MKLQQSGPTNASYDRTGNESRVTKNIAKPPTKPDVPPKPDVLPTKPPVNVKLNVETWQSGLNRYVGEMKHGMPHGNGMFTCENGDVYDGGWKNFQRHGHGICTYAGKSNDDTCNNHDNGRKIVVIHDDATNCEYSMVQYQKGDVYNGNWQNDKYNGYGKLTCAGGVIYVGQFKDFLRHGHGKQILSDGSIYEGGWKEDKRHGNGKLIFSDGGVYEGEWKDGKKSSEDTHT